MIEAVRERLAGNGDAEAVRDGEIGQGLAAGIMALREEDLREGRAILSTEGATGSTAQSGPNAPRRSYRPYSGDKSGGIENTDTGDRRFRRRAASSV